MRALAKVDIRVFEINKQVQPKLAWLLIEASMADFLVRGRTCNENKLTLSPKPKNDIHQQRPQIRINQLP